MTERVSIFISYSRRDSDFVDRLEADLDARGFDTWVDRRKLEGGNSWEEQLRQAIRERQIFLIVMSPDSMRSEFVLDEFGYALGIGKQMFPVLYRDIDVDIPMRLNRMQWSQFQDRPYDEALNELVAALSMVQPEVQQTEYEEEFETSEVELEAPQPQSSVDPDLNALFKAGIEAKAKGDTDIAVDFWQRILDRNPDFQNGYVQKLIEPLRPEAYQRRIQRLTERANEAHEAGEWGKEIGSWEALLSIQPDNSEAESRIAIAKRNQEFVWLYENARTAIEEDKPDAAREHLTLLWNETSYFGDPEGLTRQVRLQAPMNYLEYQKAEKQRQDAVQRVNEQRIAEEKRRKREAEEAEIARQKKLEEEQALERQRMIAKRFEVAAGITYTILILAPIFSIQQDRPSDFQLALGFLPVLFCSPFPIISLPMLLIIIKKYDNLISREGRSNYVKTFLMLVFINAISVPLVNQFVHLYGIIYVFLFVLFCTIAYVLILNNVHENVHKWESEQKETNT